MNIHNLLQPGMPNYESTKIVVDNFQRERQGIEKHLMDRIERETPVNRGFDIKSISLPEEKPASVGVLYEPDRDLLQCCIDYPGRSPFDRNNYFSYRLLGTGDWVVIKDLKDKDSQQPFKRKLFKGAMQSLNSVFDEFMAQCHSLIRRRADYKPEIFLE